MTKDLTTRSISGLVLITLALAALWLGDIAFWLLAVVAALLMMGEWAGLHGADARNTRLSQFALAVPLALMAPAWVVLEVHDFFTLGLLAGAAFFVAIVTRRPPLALGVLYCGAPVFSLIVLRREPDGLLLTAWAMALVWACDIGAYFSGRTFGGPKLMPRVSPNKTWAGLIGGMSAAGLFGAALWAWAGLPCLLAAVSPALAVLAQAGDLYESTMKRRAGVKDSGTIIPGHGGVLDRLDGLVPVALAAALMVGIAR